MRPGLRLSELVAIDLEDLNLSERMVRVMGKGGKERLVPFNQSTLAALKAWMQDRAAILASRRLAPTRRRRRAAGSRTSRQAAEGREGGLRSFINYRGTG